MLFDSHTHLDDEKFNPDRAGVIEKIKNSGVAYLVNIGCDLPSSRASIALAEQYDFIYATVGVHPHDAQTMDEGTLAELERLAAHPKVVAIGEIGLDYYYDNSPRGVQRYWFARQLELAERLHMPVTIHNRDAHADMLELLKNSSASGIIHCCSASPEITREFLKLGYYISFAGPLTYKNSKTAVESAKIVPGDRLLIETDAPYLAPDGFRGQRNDSSLVRHVCAKLAQIRGVPFDEMAALTCENARRVYRIGNHL